MTNKMRYDKIKDIVFTVIMMHRKYRKNKNLEKSQLPRYALLLCALAVSAAGFSGCSEVKEKSSIVLPATPALVMQTSWAVITSSHLRLRDSPSIESRAEATLWRGSILEIVSKNSAKEIVDDEEGYWYRINFDGLHGWVFGAYLKTFQSRVEAEESSRELKR
jgi:hypothetical protein